MPSRIQSWGWPSWVGRTHRVAQLPDCFCLVAPPCWSIRRLDGHDNPHSESFCDPPHAPPPHPNQLDYDTTSIGLNLSVVCALGKLKGRAHLRVLYVPADWNARIFQLAATFTSIVALHLCSASSQDDWPQVHVCKPGLVIAVVESGHRSATSVGGSRLSGLQGEFIQRVFTIPSCMIQIPLLIGTSRSPEVTTIFRTSVTLSHRLAIYASQSPWLHKATTPLWITGT